MTGQLRTISLIAALCLAQGALAEDWMCKEVASQRSGNIIKSCGFGNGADENAARSSAFQHAKKEFGSICAISSDCRGRAISVQPERTSCEKDGAGYKCYRLIVFTIGEPVSDPPMTLSGNAVGEPAPGPGEVPPAEPTPLADPLSKKELSRFEPIDIDQSESLKPFYYRDIASLPKIRVGMKKARALATFGKPHSVRTSGNSVVVYYRDRPFCDGGRCSFRFDEKTGRIISFSDFRYEYTEVLK